ncbi:NAD(P)-dependent dehydrogenase, short-chain alcohol dehydrogenase family [Sphingomonas gellani]|uniref:NAD(P)-dependent dehydrogenase, short-chain alcohol dehydrogenase family n=1 Tax=Sphingomonas gellani TaxID=1166340 RepID=A0A1H8BBH6_9SPHN|nr:SDR family oxidoreductase [Sphingomonas gellani]SEM80300.1 NAD(P)-dependent dehydrogenase, short-chain alcohol dehydrogenase family [Sphingomonas gellani]
MTILLTGSSRGIGAAIHDSLTARGATVIGHASRDADGRIGIDLDEPDGADRLWAAALERAGGRIDALVNNAGVFEANPLDGDDAEWLAGWERTMRINLTASAQLCRLAVRHWQERTTRDGYTGGRIVNIASCAAYRGDSPAHWHYAASKAGMVAMTKTIARGYAREGILAFAVCPGFTMTGMADDYLASRGGDKLLADIPLGKVADPAEVASVATYLTLDAPPSMTGAVLDVNGASYVR